MATYSPTEIKINLLAGLTVALALVPEAVAFAFVAGVHPLVGLYAAFIVGLITALIGGRPGMISGATGALAVVMVALVAQHGVEYLFATVVLMGLIQIIVGVLKWAKFIRLVPHPVMLGFVNGLAIVIFLAQMSQFKVPGTIVNTGHAECFPFRLSHFCHIYIFPKIWSNRLLCFKILHTFYFFSIDTRTVGDLGSIAGGIPEFNFPMVPLTLETLIITLPYALLLAAIGLIETLLTLNLIDDMTDTNGKPNKESMAQGIGNILTGFFGGMGGFQGVGSDGRITTIGRGGSDNTAVFLASALNAERCD